MKNKVLAVMLLAAATVLTVGCTEKDGSTKLSSIYRSGTMVLERQNPLTGEWDTLVTNNTERMAMYFFMYNDDRLDSLTDGYGDVIRFSYDDQDRLVHVEYPSFKFFYDYYYGGDGNLSRVFHYLMSGSGDTLQKETMDYTWASGNVQRIESNIVSDSVNIHESHIYTWDGDLLVKTERYTESNGGTDTVIYYYEFYDVDNPLYGNAFWQRPTSIYSFTNEGIEGFCPFVLKSITSGETVNDYIKYEITTSKKRLTGIEEKITSESTGNSGMRINSISNYEFQYTE